MFICTRSFLRQWIIPTTSLSSLPAPLFTSPFPSTSTPRAKSQSPWRLVSRICHSINSSSAWAQTTRRGTTRRSHPTRTLIVCSNPLSRPRDALPIVIAARAAAKFKHWRRRRTRSSSKKRSSVKETAHRLNIKQFVCVFNFYKLTINSHYKST